MRVTEITVKGLFGLFDHVIPLNLEDRITIIHGPNGVGKTVLLKMLDATLNGKYEYLWDISFSEFRVRFDDSLSLLVRGNEEKLGLFLVDVEKIIERHVLPIKRVKPERQPWMNALERRRLTRELDYPEWLRERQNAAPVNLIETQRLILLNTFEYADERRQTGRYVEKKDHYLMITECAQKLSEKVKAILAESAEKSQSLDRTFPARLLQHNSISVLSGTVIKDELKRLELERERLVSIGLLDAAELEVSSELPIEPQNERVLSIYIQDAKEKLGVFKDIAERLSLLQQIINKRFLFKKLSINKEQGFIFTSDITTTRIPLDGLSSGEQHELVLLYELLFNTKPNSLILIDEPEISLHVAWQMGFLRDLQEICQLASLDVIIATHSPEIVSDRWDLTVELKGPTK